MWQEIIAHIAQEHKENRGNNNVFIPFAMNRHTLLLSRKSSELVVSRLRMVLLFSGGLVFYCPHIQMPVFMIQQIAIAIPLWFNLKFIEWRSIIYVCCRR